MSVTNITAENFNTEVLESEKPVLLDFWAPWCGPCRMFSSTVDSVAEERNDIKVGKINIDENIDLANQFGVASIPTLVLVQDGRKKASSIGLRSKKTFSKCWMPEYSESFVIRSKRHQTFSVRSHLPASGRPLFPGSLSGAGRMPCTAAGSSENHCCFPHFS